MKLHTKVNVKMCRGADRSGKLVGKETNRGEWYIIKGAEGATFKARPSQVVAA